MSEHTAESDVPLEVLVRAAYALLLTADTTLEAPPDVVRWHKERETFMLAAQRQQERETFMLAAQRQVLIPPAQGH